MKPQAHNFAWQWNLLGMLILMGFATDITAQDSPYYWEQRMCTWSYLAVNDPSDHDDLMPWELEALQPKTHCYLVRRLVELNDDVIEWVPLASHSRPHWMRAAPILRQVDGQVFGSFLGSDFSTPVEDRPPLFLSQIHPDNATIAAWNHHGFMVQASSTSEGFVDLGHWRYTWSTSPPQQRWERGDSLIAFYFATSEYGYYLSAQRQVFPTPLSLGGCAQHHNLWQFERPIGYQDLNPDTWDAIDVSPTPSSHGHATIALASGRELHAERLRIRDAHGRTALEYEGAIAMPYRLKTDPLPPGHYTVQLHIGGHVITGNLIIL